MRYAFCTAMLGVAILGQSTAATLSKPKGVTITITVMTETPPPVGVLATIWQKKNSSEMEQKVAETDGSGVATVTVEDCSPDVQFRAEVKAKIRYRTRLIWLPCNAIKGNLSFLVSSTGVSKNAESILKGDLPDAWIGPKEYEPLFVDLQKAADAEQWGVVAKLSSQLSSQYRAAGFTAEANTLAEVSLYGALAPSLPNTKLPGPFVITKFKAPDVSDFVYLSPEGKSLVTSVQQSCGLPQDGVVGWKTMSCLPGGSAYSLPDAALNGIPAGAFQSGT